MKFKVYILLFTLGIFLYSRGNLLAQENEGGTPPSLNQSAAQRAKLSVPTYTTSAIPQERLNAEDAIMDQGKFPFRFGYNFDVNLDIKKEGALQVLADGSKLWTYKIECPSAISINFLYSKFHLPEGAKLFLYNEDATFILGAYTKRNNQPTEKFGTETVPGDVVTIEYLEPASPEFEGDVVIGVITHGYRTHASASLAALGAGSCNVNVNCPEAAGWENQKRAVARIIMNGNTLCSGTLINNARQDDKAYFMTANHCIGDLDAVSKPDASGWVFYWNYESATCAGTSGPETQTTAGATVRANNSQSDFALVELKSKPAAAYNVYYAGWNRSTVASNGAVGIHHPAGDIKKFSKDNSTMQDDNGTHWKVPSWDIGVTEGGSSGSGLFDLNKRFIGQLTGGASGCGVASTSLWDVYGKLSYSWDQGGTTPQTRLKDWLDPDNTGVVTIDGKNPGTTSNNAPTITLTSPADKSGYSAPANISIAATATDSDGSISKVEFYNGTTKLGEDLSAPFTYSWNNVAVGNYTITAKATDNGGATGTSAPVQIIVTTLRNPENPANTVSGIDYGYYEGSWNALPDFSTLTVVKTGNVSVIDLTQRNRDDNFGFQFNGYLNIATDGVYNFYTSSDDGSQLYIGTTLVVNNDGLHGNQEMQGTIGLKAGKHAIRVVFFELGGDQILTASYSGPSINKQTIPATALFRTSNITNVPPTVSLTAPINNTTYTAPASITITASATDSDGSIAKVDFYNGTTLLGTDTNAPYSFTWTNVATGTYTLSAKATDNAAASTTSTSVTVQVNNPVNQSPTVNITSPLTNASFVAPASIVINVNASDADGSVTKVEFYNGSTKLGEDLSSPYSVTWTGVTAGNYSLTAKATDNTGASTTSSVVTITVTSAVDNCSNIASYAAGNTYTAGNQVKNEGRIYECKPWPYSGWCSGAAWAYAPGTGMYWSDAWVNAGSCSKSKTTETSETELSLLVSPNPTDNIVTIEVKNLSTSQINVQLFDALGNNILSKIITNGNQLDLSEVNSGVYTLRTIVDGEVFTSRVIKK